MRLGLGGAIWLGLLVGMLLSCANGVDPRLAGSWRGEERNGWIPVRLQGSPAQIGFQHGYLLAPEVEDVLKVIRLSLSHD